MSQPNQPAKPEDLALPTGKPSEGKQRNYQGEYYNHDPLQRQAELMTDDVYLRDRVENQIAWFDRKSQESQKQYKKYKRIEFIIAATIPVITTFSTFFSGDDYRTIGVSMQIVAAIFGVILVVINKSLELGDYLRYWKEYRATCESLQYERNLYLTKTEPYDESDAYPLLVSRVESLLSSEVQRWQQRKKQFNGKKEAEKEK